MLQLVLLLLPTLIALAVLYRVFPRFTTKEYILVSILGILLVSGEWLWARQNVMTDIEYWNGRVVSKDNGTQSCCHCTNVCRSTDEDGNCTRWEEVCTHTRDYWWSATLSTGDVEEWGCRGSRATPRWWTSTHVGDPAVYPHSYTNYLKADPHSLKTPFSDLYEDMVEDFPSPPDGDPLKIRRVLTTGEGLDALRYLWQRDLEETNADLGSRYQVDAYIYATTVLDPKFADAVKSKWTYGPKNAVTLVLGLDGDKIAWVRVVSLSDLTAFRVKVRNALLGKSIRDDVVTIYAQHIAQEFERTPMAEYSYLATQVRIPTWQMVLFFLFNMVLSFIAGSIMEAEDIFGEDWQRRRFR